MSSSWENFFEIIWSFCETMYGSKKNVCLVQQCWKYTRVAQEDKATRWRCSIMLISEMPRAAYWLFHDQTTIFFQWKWISEYMKNCAILLWETIEWFSLDQKRWNTAFQLCPFHKQVQHPLTWQTSSISTVHLFPKGCIYICKFYCTENIQNVHNYRYIIPQAAPAIPNMDVLH